MKWIENCRLKCSFWWWWKDLIKINSREPLCLILLPWCCVLGGGLPRCRALHLDEAKRVRDVSLMTQTQTSWRMHYRQHAAGRDASNTGKPPQPYFLPKIQTPKYKGYWNNVTKTEWENEKTGHMDDTQISFCNILSEIGVKCSEGGWKELLK